MGELHSLVCITISRQLRGKGRGMEKKKKKKNWNLAAINARPSDKSKSKVGQELYRADNRRVV